MGSEMKIDRFVIVPAQAGQAVRLADVDGKGEVVVSEHPVIAWEIEQRLWKEETANAEPPSIEVLPVIAVRNEGVRACRWSYALAQGGRLVYPWLCDAEVTEEEFVREVKRMHAKENGDVEALERAEQDHLTEPQDFL